MNKIQKKQNIRQNFNISLNSRPNTLKSKTFLKISRVIDKTKLDHLMSKVSILYNNS